MYCKYCGREIDSGAVYCSHCGKSQTGSQLPGSQLPRLNLQIPNPAHVQVSEDLCMIATILLSVMTLISFMLKWVIAESRWFDIESVSFLGLVQATFSGEMDSIVAWVVILIGVVAAIMHVYAVVMAATRKKDFLGTGASAATWTLILSILAWIFVLVIKHAADEEWDGLSSLIHLGTGLICCFIFSLLQMFLSYYLRGKVTTSSSAQVYSDHAVTCTDCGTRYVRITAATACPSCGSHAYESESNHTGKSVLCAYCGTRFEQKSTSTRCPQCGRVQP